MTKIGDTESISLCAQTETLTALLELQVTLPRQLASSQSADGAGHSDVQLNAPALHLPTPRATGRVD
jgi:hypothetical protein